MSSRIDGTQDEHRSAVVSGEESEPGIPNVVTRIPNGRSPAKTFQSTADLPRRARGPSLTLTRAMSPAPDWGHPGKERGFLSPQPILESSSGVSSLVKDNGENQELDNAERESVQQDPVGDTSFSGAQFDDARSISSHLSIENHVSPPPLTTIRNGPEADNKYMQDAIGESRIECLGKKDRFLPLDCLARIVTVVNVENELRMYPHGHEHDISRIARQVVEVEMVGKGERTTRRKIFAVLALMKKSPVIEDFIDRHIYDNDLPFEFKSPGKVVLRRQRPGVNPDPIDFFHSWELHDRELFDKYQWEINPPYFELSWEPGKRVYHYILAPKAIIPFLEETYQGPHGSNSIDFSGGTATVKKVKIHKAHYNSSSSPNTLMYRSQYFAVKTLKWSDESARALGRDIEREALALKRFVDVKTTDEAHHHLIRLLATYSHGGHLHMIFPCADGNLQDFWQKQPNPAQPPRDAELAIWMARQCLGLAIALQRIHKSHIDATNPQKLDPDYWRKRHGRHGDLKPENILYFGAIESTPAVVLKISDFGFADFHGSHSLKVMDRNSIGGVTPTYRAPEFDVTQEVSPAYDIWSLGCVLLQFVVWYLRGWAGVDEFSKKRTADSVSPIKEDNFFNFYEARSAARTKPSVSRQINVLRAHPQCSEYVLELLDFINEHLLKLDPEKRAGCDQVVEKLRKMHDHCKKDQRYRTTRFSPIQHTDTGRSEFVRYERLPENEADPINVVRAASINAFGSSGDVQAQLPQSKTAGIETTETTPPLDGALVGVNGPPLLHPDAFTNDAQGKEKRSVRIKELLKNLFGSCFGIPQQYQRR